MNRRKAVALIAAGSGLAGCAAVAQEAANVGLTAEAVAKEYAIVKGIAEIASLVPALTLPISAAIMVMDPLVAGLETAMASAAQLAAISAQTTALLIAAAPGFKVVSRVPV